MQLIQRKRRHLFPILPRQTQKVKCFTVSARFQHAAQLFPCLFFRLGVSLCIPELVH